MLAMWNANDIASLSKHVVYLWSSASDCERLPQIVCGCNLALSSRAGDCPRLFTIVNDYIQLSQLRGGFCVIIITYLLLQFRSNWNLANRQPMVRKGCRRSANNAAAGPARPSCNWRQPGATLLTLLTRFDPHPLQILLWRAAYESLLLDRHGFAEPPQPEYQSRQWPSKHLGSHSGQSLHRVDRSPRSPYGHGLASESLGSSRTKFAVFLVTRSKQYRFMRVGRNEVRSGTPSTA